MRVLAWVFPLALGAACSADGGSSGTGGNGGGGGSAASGASSGTGGGIIVPDGSAGNDGSPLGDAACATSINNGERIPLDMYIVFDRSGSMSTQAGGQTLWDATKQAFITFVNAPGSVGTGMGLQFFPPGTASGANCLGSVPPSCPTGCMPFGPYCVPAGDSGCSVNDYLPPAVFIEQLPAVASKITTALNATSPGGGTPTLPAMQAAAQAVSAHAAQNPDRKAIIVLATDGNPNDCSSNTQNVAQVAAGAFNGNPSVATFVIGINNSGVNVSGLHSIAQSGGTGQALIVDPNNAGAEFLAAIEAIQGQALGCTFKMPKPGPGETLNPNQVNVWFTPPSGTPTLIYKVSGPAQCDPTLGGWYYDDPTSPTEIALCPASCTAIEGTKGEVRIELGCTSVLLPR